LDLSHPERLLLLALAPLLWWLARPPRPRLAFVTAHLAQWRQALASLRRRPVRFRRLRFWLLIAALGAIGAAAAGPRVGVRSGPRELAVLLDASASTGAREAEGPTALALAEAALRATLGELSPEVAVRVLVLGRDTRVLDGGRDAILAELAEVGAEGSPGVTIAAVAARLAGPERAVWTLTDGRGPDELPADGALSVFGASEMPNVGIVDVEVVDAWPLPEVELRVQVVGAATFELDVAGGAERRGSLELGAPSDGGLVEARLPLQRGAGGEVEVALRHEGRDALEADNRVRIVLAPPPAPDVAVLRGPGGGQWVERAARALAELGQGRVVAAAASGDRAGFLLADGGELAVEPPRSLTFGTALGGPGEWRAGGAPVDWDREHPLTRRLDLSELRVTGVLGEDRLPADGVPLIAGREGPWLVALDREGRRSVHAAFRLDESNLPLLPAFPQLLRRAFAWCYGAGARTGFDPASLPGRRESVLVRSLDVAAERPLPPFGSDGFALTVPLLALAFLLLGARLYA
jgi:hypothetical protein